MVSTKDFAAYELKAMRRGARKTARRQEKLPWSHHANTLIKEADDILSRVRYVSWQVERILDSFPNEFASTLSKWAAFASEVFRAGLLIAVFGVGVFLYV